MGLEGSAQASETSSQALGPTKAPLRLGLAQQTGLESFGLGLVHHYMWMRGIALHSNVHICSLTYGPPQRRINRIFLKKTKKRPRFWGNEVRSSTCWDEIATYPFLEIFTIIFELIQISWGCRIKTSMSVVPGGLKRRSIGVNGLLLIFEPYIEKDE